MLILSRHVDESIIIGDHDCLIQVMVIDVSVWDPETKTKRVIQNPTVRLGINAPREIPVHRHEIYEAIQRGEKP